MPSSEREASRDRESAARHHHSAADTSKAMSVPMWDSSDPDRAPPPLPLNPGVSSTSSPTKPNTSAGIAAAAKAIVEKARESAPVSSYTSNLPMSQSPEKQLIKGAHHRRFQSLQPGNVKDLRSYLDGNRSPERSPERPASRGALSPLSSLSRQTSRDDIFGSSERTATPTPSSRDTGRREASSALPASRPRPRSFLGENTPPSATMLALQTMQVPETPLSDVTNRPNTPNGTPTRVSNTYDFSSQLLNLTAIATNLQKEMASLSRRSKDNATDLVSLKEATSQRDEDIRKSLRDLATQFQASTVSSLGPPPTMRSLSGLATSFMDGKSFSTPPSASKTYDVPRAASVHSFLDDTRLGSPSPYSVEGAASVAMLEKIIREMVTKEGQEKLLETLSELLDRSHGENVEASRKVEELVDLIKTKTGSQALVPLPAERTLSPHLSGVRSGSGVGQKGEVDDEVMKLLTRIKDSISHSGGTSAEVKGLVRDLRGEVLGMGRELGRKLEQLNDSQLNQALEKSIEDGQARLQSDDVQRIVGESMAELKDHLASLIVDRLDSPRDLSAITAAPNGDEMFAVVKHALAEHGHDLIRREIFDSDSGIGMDRGSVVDAVREGLKDFEPNIELQQFGLEREEILAVLREGLEDHQQQRRSDVGASSIDKAEVYEAMQEALKDFRAPVTAEALDRLREDILADVRTLLEQQLPASADNSSIPHGEELRLALEAAVKDGLANYGPAAPRELEISRDDLFDAVKSSLDGSTIPFGSFGEQVLQQMHELIDGMRIEFKQYSTASGRDTEQVLDAVKDGLENLRGEIENYVDRAQDVTGKDEIIDTVRGGLEQLRADVQGYCTQGQETRPEMLEYIKAEFEHLHEAVNARENTREVNSPRQDHTAAIILAIKEGMEHLKDHVSTHSRGLTDEQPSEEMFEAMKVEFDQLKAAVLNAHAADKCELVETIQDSMGALHAKIGGSELSQSTGVSHDEVIHEMQGEFAALKETLHSIIGDADREALVSGVQASLDDMRTHLVADQTDASAEALGLIKEELEAFRESFATSLVPGGSAGHEHLESIRTHLEDLQNMHADRPASAVPDELLEAMRGEFEQLRSLITGGTLSERNHDEVLEALRLGLDDLRSHLERRLDHPERGSSQQEEMLEAIHEGLEDLKTEVVKTLDKPLDMTVNYEILDTLKDGLAALRADVDTLKSSGEQPGGEIVLADGSRGSVSRDVAGDDDDKATSTDGPLREDIEALGVLIHQLQIKVEAMDATVQEISPSSQTQPSNASHEQLADIEETIKAVQGGLSLLLEQRRESPPEGAARKEDTDAIETLLRNTKSQLDDIQVTMPRMDATVTKEHLDAVEAVARVTQESVDALADKLENSTAAKADVAVVEVLAQDVKATLDEIKGKLLPEDDCTLLTRADFDVLGVMCTEIKEKVEALVSPDPDTAPQKADLELIQNLINDFRESHDKLRDSYETDIAVTAKAFDDRKTEFEQTVEQIGAVKDALAVVKDELISKLSDNDSGLNTLGETLKGLEDKVGDNEPILANLKEEFERAHASLESIKIDHQQVFDVQLEKSAEHKSNIITELGEKLDTLFDGLMSKYDDAQQAATDKAQVVEEKAQRQEEVLESTRSMAEELRLSIDTLGTALTTFTADYPTQMEKLAEDSKTVFNKVDDTWGKIEETKTVLKEEHAVTREEVVRVMATLSAVQNDMLEHHPRFLVTLQEVQALMGQHYDHAQKASDAAEEHREAVRQLSDQLKAGFDETRSRHAEHTEELKTSLPALMAPSIAPSDTPLATAMFDDSLLHEKLDRLIGHAGESSNSTVQIERLNEIHEKVMATAAEVSSFVSAQAKQITENHENQEREAEELSLLVERRMVQKDKVEDDINVLNQEKESLQHAVEALRSEREALAAQKARLNADVSSLETALRIRREELHEMDQKAELIERRMLEGVMNQNRMLLLTKPPRSAPQKKHTGRDLRVPSTSSNRSSQTVTSSVPPLKANHSLALRARPPIARHGALANSGGRRIMSLNEINHNVPTGAQAFSTATPSLLSTGPQSMKRSQSVRTQAAHKTSWAPKRHLSMTVRNKENERLSEEDEFDLERSECHDGDDEDFNSDTGTERRTSYLSDSQSGITFAEDETTADMASAYGSRLSYGTSDLSYGTGSYLTNSEMERRSSLGSSADGIVGMTGGAPTPSGEHSDDGEQHSTLEDLPNGLGTISRPLKHFSPPSDSGLGTDLPTAAVMSGSEYFRSDND